MRRHYQYEPTPVPIIESDQTPAEIVGEDHTTGQHNTTITGGKVPVPVVQIEPIRVHQFPSKATGWRTFELNFGSAPVKILDEDRRRKRAVIFAFDTALTSTGIRLGQSQAEAASPYAFQLAITNGASFVVSQQLEYSSYTEVWASAMVADCSVSVLNEQWSD